MGELMYEIIIRNAVNGAEIERVTAMGFITAKRISLLLSSHTNIVTLNHIDEETHEPIRKNINIWQEWG